MGSYQDPTNSSMQWHLCCKIAHASRLADGGRAPSAPGDALVTTGMLNDALGSLSLESRLRWAMASLTLTASAVGAAVPMLRRYHHRCTSKQSMDARFLL